MLSNNVKSGSRKLAPLCASARGIRYCTAATRKDAMKIKTFALIATMKSCTSILQISSGASRLLAKVTSDGQ